MRVIKKQSPKQSPKKSREKSKSRQHAQTLNNLYRQHRQNIIDKNRINSRQSLESSNRNMRIQEDIINNTLNKNQPQFSFRSFMGSQNDKESQLRYKYKWEEAIKENSQLKQKIKCVTLENLELKNKNQVLEINMGQLLGELSQYKNIYTGLRKIPEFNTENLNERTQFIEKRKVSSKSASPQGKTPSINNFMKQSNYKYKYDLLKKLAQNLSSQNQLLIEFKTTCIKKISQLKQQLQNIYTQYSKQKEISIHLQHKYQQQYKIHLQDQKTIHKLQDLLKKTDEQMNDISRHVKLQHQERELSHERFHRDMSKMKEKAQKYRNKAMMYRNQRDQLALEIQRAKLEIGTVTLRKYFPDDSDEED